MIHEQSQGSIASHWVAFLRKIPFACVGEDHNDPFPLVFGAGGDDCGGVEGGSA